MSQCFKCNKVGTIRIVDNHVVSQIVKGEAFEIHSPATVCSNCGFAVRTPEQGAEARQKASDAYRKKHGLLTSVQIRATRKLLDLNQQEFAAKIGVGPASVKRWETWMVQEPQMDQRIRMGSTGLLAIYTTAQLGSVRMRMSLKTEDDRDWNSPPPRSFRNVSFNPSPMTVGCGENAGVFGLLMEAPCA